MLCSHAPLAEVHSRVVVVLLVLFLLLRMLLLLRFLLLLLNVDLWHESLEGQKLNIDRDRDIDGVVGGGSGGSGNGGGGEGGYSVRDEATVVSLFW